MLTTNNIGLINRRIKRFKSDNNYYSVFDACEWSDYFQGMVRVQLSLQEQEISLKLIYLGYVGF